MKVVAKTVWKAVKPGEVYPRDFGPGDEIPDWAEPAAAIAAGAAEQVDDAASDAEDVTEDGSTPSRVVARVTVDCQLKLDGRTTKFKAGKTVYDEVARMLVDLGNAVEIRADEGAPETK